MSVALLDRPEASSVAAAAPRVAASCAHCGDLCPAGTEPVEGRAFCCAGCRTVFELLRDCGLGDFHGLDVRTRVRGGVAPGDRFAFMDDPEVRARLVDYSDDTLTRVTFRVPAVHCVACVWLLENLFRLRPGIGRSRVNLGRREVSVDFDPRRVRLGDVGALLASLGYEPDLKSSDLGARRPDPLPRGLWLRIGVAGFAFGNTMLFAIAGYLGLDSASGPAFRQMTGWISLALSVPVVAYCARDYWAAAWLGLRRRMAVIEIPIAVGIAALFGRSVYDFLSGRGEGYFDSLAGLLFFLLCGKAFQQRVHERLVFDRDYRSFFPLAVTRRRDGREERAALSRLSVGDRLVIRHGEIIPADARLVAGGALIDYAFVTGESCPVARSAGDLLYAGGRQTAGAIEIDTVKPVSQGYLASLWDQEAFRKEKPDAMDRITNAYSRRFTRIILGIAGGAAAWWWASGDPKRGIDAFVSVLIVACPCALALAAPFTLGTAQRVLASCGVHLKNPFVAETLSRVDAVVFDKTGTLTRPGAAAAWHGRPLAPDEREAVAALAACSTHPLAARIATPVAGSRRPVVGAFRETPGSGLEGDVSGRRILLGSAAWLRANGVATPSSPAKDASGPVHVALDGAYRGAFVGESALRPDAERIPGMLAGRCDLALLSGDDDHERARFEALFGGRAELRFRQTPADKLEFVDRLQRGGRTVLMIGDGLNDAGALRRGDVGVAVVEDVGAFSPASDVILAAEMVPRLPEILRFARGSVRLVRAGFLVSGVYNVAGIAIAAAGLLSPVVCAVLMPLSSVSVVAFACLATRRLGRRVFGRAGEEPA